MTQNTELTTARLIIRTPRESDVNDIYALMADAETALSTGFRPMTDPSEAEGKIRRGMAGGLMFAIAEKTAPGRVAGVFEVAPHTTKTASGERLNYEICYFLGREARGKGYMTEVVGRMKDYLFGERGADSLTIAVLPRNDASRRVALKNGFAYERLDKRCGMTFRDELVDLESYTLSREEYLNPGSATAKEHVETVERQKWIIDGGILYPIPGSATLLPCPDRGVFRIHEDGRTKRLGLEKIDDSFTFSFKVYDLDCEDIMKRVIKVWTSAQAASSVKNLGVIFNGLKGTGKTIAAKLLCNRTGLPVIVVSRPMEGLLEFVQSLCFECAILIDEAEKTFAEERDMLLKMIDGVYNSKRKLYILTTNKLAVDENLLGRPGRIRYIKEFANLPAKAVSEVIDDNLDNPALKDGILKLVDTLEISTIDILKAIIDECNIMGEVPADTTLNIPKAKYKVRVISFDDLDDNLHAELRGYITDRLAPGETVEEWLMAAAGTGEDKKTRRNKDEIEERFDCTVDIQTQPSASLCLYPGLRLRYGTISSVPDAHGFFTLETDWNDGTCLCCAGNSMGKPSLYRGSLF